MYLSWGSLRALRTPGTVFMRLNLFVYVQVCKWDGPSLVYSRTWIVFLYVTSQNERHIIAASLSGSNASLSSSSRCFYAFESFEPLEYVIASTVELD